MSWIPPDLSSMCAVYATVTSCSPSSMLFLNLVAEIFGGSRDSYNFGNFGQHQFNGDGGHFGGSQEYDFIVVGAGSAGCVVANRLSEIKEWNVLLLEAGGEEPEVADVPAFAPLLQRSSIDWGYMTQPSPHSCRSRDDGRCAWARGKVMGGSSTINYMIYTRGHPLDYDEWAGAGNPGWKFKEVLPYFIKSEDNRNLDRVDGYYHGIGGYQTVEVFPYQDKNVGALIHAFTELGLEEVDAAGKRLVGTSLLQHTTRDGERLSTNGAFIRPIRNHRENLEVRPNTLVTRILIDAHTKIAIGVEIVGSHGELQQIYARKEVILSAGTINSPKLLMVSGVGPSDELERYGIKVIEDLAVGFNLQDHTTIDGVLLALTNKTATTATDEQREYDIKYYKETHTGPLSATGSLQVNAFVQTLYAEGDRPDIQYSFDGVNVMDYVSDPLLASATRILPASYYDGIMVRPILLSPKSRGAVRLNDTDPLYGDPLIMANTFSEKIDLLRIVEGTKQSLNLLQTHKLQKLGYQLVDIPWPSCSHYTFGTDEYWSCIAMEYTTTIFHPVGTCKMGPKNDKEAVVDAKLRVYGIKNLRVIDASIMPTIVRGNTNAPTIMIAEKGSDYIKNSWLKVEAYSYSAYDVTEKNY